MSGRIVLGVANPALDAAGVLDTSATLTFYQPGTTTLQNIFSDDTLSTTLSNPLSCDAEARFPQVWAPNESIYDVKWSPTGETPIVYTDIAPIRSATHQGVHSSDYSTPAQALSVAISTSQIWVHDVGTYTASANLDLSTTLVGFRGGYGGLIKPNGYTVTLPANAMAPPMPWIDLSAGGHVQAGKMNCPGYPEWYVGCVADVVGTLGTNGFSVASGTDCTAYIQELMDYGPWELRYSSGGAYLITSVTRKGDHCHHHIFPQGGGFGEVGFVGSGATANYLSEITNSSAIEKRSGIKYVVQSGHVGSDGGYNDLWSNLSIVTTDFDHVIAWGQLYGGDGANRTVNFCNLDAPHLRGYIGFQAGTGDYIVLNKPTFDGKWAAVAWEVPQAGSFAVINKVAVYAPNFSQLINTSGYIFYSKNYAATSPSQELKCITITGGTFEYGFVGIYNEWWQADFNNIWMERVNVAGGGAQLTDNGRCKFNMGHYSAGDITGSLAAGSTYFDGIVLNGGAAGIVLGSNGAALSWNGFINANAAPVSLHRFTTPNNVSEGDPIADFYGKNTYDTVIYAMVGAGANLAAATGFVIQKNSTTGRSINAAGTLNASGADYAEYRKVVPKLSGKIPKGDVLGMDARGLLTNVFRDVVGRVFIKSTRPGLVGNDVWGSEEYICKTYDLAPVNEFSWSDDAHIEAICGFGNPFALPSGMLAGKQALEDKKIRWTDAVEKEKTSASERKKSFLLAAQKERELWDRVALCGLVPCNVTAGISDVGSYLISAEGADGKLTARLKRASDLTLDEYIGSFGVIESIGDDGRPNVSVKAT